VQFIPVAKTPFVVHPAEGGVFLIELRCPTFARPFFGADGEDLVTPMGTLYGDRTDQVVARNGANFLFGFPKRRLKGGFMGMALAARESPGVAIGAETGTFQKQDPLTGEEEKPGGELGLLIGDGQQEQTPWIEDRRKILDDQASGKIRRRGFFESP
jgi:hypothetical protein